MHRKSPSSPKPILVATCSALLGLSFALVGCPNENEGNENDNGAPAACDDCGGIVGGGFGDNNENSEDADTVCDCDNATQKTRLFARARADAWEVQATGTMPPNIGISPAVVALPGRRALFTGGLQQNEPSTDAFLYDQSSGNWTTLSGLRVPRESHKMVALNDGRVMIIAGNTAGRTQTATTEFFDPATMQFSDGPTMNRARVFHSVVLLDDGRVLIAGGDISNTTSESIEVYDPATNEFMLIENLEIQPRAAAKLRDGRVLMVGDFVVPAAFVFEPDTNSFAPVGDMNNMHAVFPTATALPDGRVLVAGGCSRDAFATNKTDIFDPDTDTFSEGPDMTENRDRHVAMLMPDGLVLIIGGMDNGEFYASGEFFDHTDDTITRMGTEMSTSRVDFAGVALIP